MTDEEFKLALIRFLKAKDDDLLDLPAAFPEELQWHLDDNIAYKVVDQLISLKYIDLECYGGVVKSLISDYLYADIDEEELKTLVNKYIDANNECVIEYNDNISSDVGFWIIVGTYFGNEAAKESFDEFEESFDGCWIYDVDLDQTALEYYDRMQYENLGNMPPSSIIKILETSRPSYWSKTEFYSALYYCYKEVGKDKDAKKVLKELSYCDVSDKKKLVIFQSRKSDGIEIDNPLYKEPGTEKDPETIDATTKENVAVPKKAKTAKDDSEPQTDTSKRKGRKASSSSMKNAKKVVYNKLVKPLKKWF